MICVSVVSHGHGGMVAALVDQLLACPQVAQIIVTRNIPEPALLAEQPRLLQLENTMPQGFGANHNAAFTRCTQPRFCVMNPDIQLAGNPFETLADALRHTRAAMVAPLIVSATGGLEDSVRRFPTPWTLVRKLVAGDRGGYAAPDGSQPFFPDWVAGMFMLFDSAMYAQLGGFDPGFFLYYEDVDLCARIWKAGHRVAVCPAARAIHDARRASHRNPRFMAWHLSSMARYFFKHLGRLPRTA
jgi:GT2 family glycosyltransferase